MTRHVQALAAQRGLEVPDAFVQGVHPQCNWWTKPITQMLMSLPPAQRPDGLYVADDNLLEAATAGLLAANMAVPREVMVVAHTNFPWPTHSYVPVIRLGFDVSRILTTCIARIDEQRRGETPPAVTWMSAQFAEELAELPSTASII